MTALPGATGCKNPVVTGGEDETSVLTGSATSTQTSTETTISPWTKTSTDYTWDPFDAGPGPVEDPDGAICGSQNAEASILPVRLAFVFDVSGSMGKKDYAYHDPKLKWDPVVTATKAFFENKASAGLFASMTFFPSRDFRCVDATYETPTVPFTALPSPAFGEALDAYRTEEWRGGTPTIYALRGAYAYVAREMATTAGRYVMVLVTDGYPQGCSGTPPNTIEAVVAETATVAETLPVYVVGVKNPPGGPDTVSDLGSIAVAGKTKAAFIIDTGNPAKTSSDFQATIEKIRGYSISCIMQIPKPPAGSVFQKENVIVSYTTGGKSTSLTYDPACASPNAWSYDDPVDPKLIKLCPEVCKAIQDESSTKINIEFTCEPVIVIVY